MSTELRHETAPEDRISFPHKLIYGLGAFVNNLLAGAIGGMTIVLNLGLGMNPALVGLLGAGAWQQRSSPLRLSPQEPPLFHRQRVDALPHPVVGVLTDRIGPVISAPHMYQTMPGAIPKLERSHAFKWFAVLMSLGFVATAVLGVYMAWRPAAQRRLVILCLVVGVLLPTAFMWSSLRPAVP